MGFILLNAALLALGSETSRGAKRKRKPIGVTQRRVAVALQRRGNPLAFLLEKVEQPHNSIVGEEGLGGSVLKPSRTWRTEQRGACLGLGAAVTCGPISKLDTSQNNFEARS